MPTSGVTPIHLSQFEFKPAIIISKQTVYNTVSINIAPPWKNILLARLNKQHLVCQSEAYDGLT